ncbi:hypothetical protein BC831DRAFT_477002 [Entophlyctis helioformis]|nr:hypothetical protein BC831DRAFT_477002 [Entophlyctis helioformis]
MHRCFAVAVVVVVAAGADVCAVYCRAGAVEQQRAVVFVVERSCRRVQHSTQPASQSRIESRIVQAKPIRFHMQTLALATMSTHHPWQGRAGGGGRYGMGCIHPIHPNPPAGRLGWDAPLPPLATTSQPSRCLRRLLLLLLALP